MTKKEIIDTLTKSNLVFDCECSNDILILDSTSDGNISFAISDKAKLLLQNNSKNEKSVSKKIAIVSQSMLDIEKKDYDLNDIYNKAIEIGFKLLIPTDSISLRKGYPQQEPMDWVLIGSKVITTDKNNYLLYLLANENKEMKIDTFHNTSGIFWSKAIKFAFEC